MRNYKVILSEYQLNILNQQCESDNKRKKLLSILSYLTKHSENGIVKYSANKLLKMYLRYHTKISPAYWRELIKELSCIGLLNMERIGRNCIYKVLSQATNKTTNENTPSGVEITSIGGSLKKPKYKTKDYNTITISKRETLTKKELTDLARELMIKIGVRDGLTQRVILTKIKTMKTKVKVFGAINYVQKIIYEKLEQTTNEWTTTYANGLK